MRVADTLRFLLTAAALLVVTGCRHKVQVAQIALPPPTTVPLVPAPEPSSPPRLPQQPVSPAPLPTEPVQPKPKKHKKKVDPPTLTQPAAVTPPVEVASTGPAPSASVIGALTAGGDASPAQRQQASDAINEVEKRLAGLTTDTLKSQEQGVTQVKNFVRQAKEALNTGDAEGSITLATKAKVLLDDLLK